MINSVVVPTGLHTNHTIWKAVPHGNVENDNGIFQFSWNGRVPGIPLWTDLDATNIDLQSITLK